MQTPLISTLERGVDAFPNLKVLLDNNVDIKQSIQIIKNTQPKTKRQVTTLLQLYVLDKNIEKVKQALATTESLIKESLYLIPMAILINDIVVLRELVNCGIEIEHDGELKVLNLAAFSGNVDMLEALLQLFNISANDSKYGHPMYTAVARVCFLIHFLPLFLILKIQGNLDFMEALVKLNSEDGSRNINNTALKFAILHSNKEAIQKLIALGLDISHSSSDTLLFAARHKKLDMIRYLFGLGLQIDNNNNKESVVQVFASSMDQSNRENVEIVKELIKMGSKWNINKDFKRITSAEMVKELEVEPFLEELAIYAAEKEDIEMIYELGKKGYGKKYYPRRFNAIHQAAIHHNIRAIEALVDVGCYINDSDYKLPLVLYLTNNVWLIFVYIFIFIYYFTNCE